jgi:hypothetical protein
MGLAVMLLLAPAVAAAQLIPTKLPTPQGGDFGNGASTSSVAGGAFAYGREVRAAPAVAYGIPIGFGATRGQVFGAAAAQRGLRGDRDFVDGAVFWGQGFGDAHRYGGVEVTLANYSTLRNTFRNRSLSLKLHRRLGAGLGVAVGVENAFIAGHPDGGRSAFAVASYRHRLWSGGALLRSTTGTVGVGDGRFNSVQRVRRDVNKASVFASLSVQLARPLSVLATWNGQDLTIGASVAFRPVAGLPVVVTPVVLDATRYAGDRPRLALSVGTAVQLW